jgi:hypothetical protein
MTFSFVLLNLINRFCATVQGAGQPEVLRLQLARLLHRVDGRRADPHHHRHHPHRSRPVENEGQGCG